MLADVAIVVINDINVYCVDMKIYANNNINTNIILMLTITTAKLSSHPCPE